MDTLSKTLSFVAVGVIGALMLALKDWFVSWQRQRYYASMQSGRPALSNPEFCERAGLDPSVAGTVAIVRSKLGECGRCDPDRIYPDDRFYPHFGLAYDDDVACVVAEMDVIPGFDEDSFPLEDVESVADFVGVILRLRDEAEPSAGASAASPHRAT
jgi:hypothetical protein